MRDFLIGYFALNRRPTKRGQIAPLCRNATPVRPERSEGFDAALITGSDPSLRSGRTVMGGGSLVKMTVGLIGKVNRCYAHHSVTTQHPFALSVAKGLMLH